MFKVSGEFFEFLELGEFSELLGVNELAAFCECSKQTDGFGLADTSVAATVMLVGGFVDNACSVVGLVSEVDATDEVEVFDFETFGLETFVGLADAVGDSLAILELRGFT